MATDANVQVNVKATADVQQAKAALADLMEQGELTAAQFKQLSATYGDITQKKPFEAALADLRGVNTETKGAAEGMDLFKINTSKALGETQVLIRELATGSFHARTLGSLLSALGPAITAAGIAAILLFEWMKKMSDAQEKMVADAEKFNRELDRSVEKWAQMAKEAESIGDQVHLADAMHKDVQKASDELDAFVRKVKNESIFAGMFDIFGTGAMAKVAEFLHLTENVTKTTRAANKELDDAAAATDKWGQALERIAQGDGIKVVMEFREAVADADRAAAAAVSAAQAKPDDPKLEKARQDALENQRLAHTQLAEILQALEKNSAAILKQGELWKEVNKELEKNAKILDDENKDYIARVAAQERITQQTEDEARIRNAAGDEEQVIQAKVIKEYDDQIARLAQKGIYDEEAIRQATILAEGLRHQLEVLRGQGDALADELALWRQINSELDKEGKKLDDINAKRINQFISQTNYTQQIEDEAAIRAAAGNDEAVIQAKVTAEYHKQIAAAAAKNIYGDEAERLATLAASTLEHQLHVQEGQGTEQSALNVQMKEYETILQNIRQQQQVTGAQSFIGVDQKDMILLRQYRSEIVTVINAMQQQQQRKAVLTDPAEIAKANQELQKFSAQYQLLAAKIVTTTHQFQAGLQSWANSFGSVGQQLATTLQQTVGAALQSFNQWVVTGKFNLQQLLQSVVQLGLQLVEQLLIQRAVGLINASLAETQAVASAQIIAAAWAGAATAVTTATEGQAAYGAPAALAIGLAGVKGVLGIGSLHEGGPVQRMHSGGLAHDEVPIIAQEGEIMIRRSVAQRDGMADFLLGLNAGEFHDGGFVAGDRYHRGSGGGGDHIVSGGTFSDMAGFELGNPREMLWFANMFAGFGTFPSTGIPAFGGSTMIPTTWVNYPGVGLVPMATGPDTNLQGVGRTHNLRSTQHTGGMISRMHSGGGVSGRGGGGGVHIYAFTDLKQLVRHMGSKDGQKIIFDTVKGRRIDLGIS